MGWRLAVASTVMRDRRVLGDSRKRIPEQRERHAHDGRDRTRIQPGPQSQTGCGRHEDDRDSTAGFVPRATPQTVGNCPGTPANAPRNWAPAATNVYGMLSWLDRNSPINKAELTARC